MCRYPQTRGISLPRRDVGSCHPWFLGGDLASVAHPCSDFSPLPLAKLKRRAGVPGWLCWEVPAVPNPGQADPVPCGGS